MQYLEMGIENDQKFPVAPVHQLSRLPCASNDDCEPSKSQLGTGRWHKKMFRYCSGITELHWKDCKDQQATSSPGIKG